MKHTEIFTGRIGKIYELKTIGEGNFVINFSVAETPRKKNKATGQWEDGTTLWTNVTLFGHEARNFARTAAAGNFVTVMGYREAREYTPQDSSETKRTESVIAEQVSFAVTRFNFIEGIGSVDNAGNVSTGRKPAGAAQSSGNAQASAPAAQADPFATGGSAVNDDPFATNFGGGADEDPFGAGGFNL